MPKRRTHKPYKSTAKTVSSLLLSIMLSFSLVSCSTTPDGPSPGNGATPTDTSTPAVQKSVECTDPRPEMCTMDYRPVCATIRRNIQCVTTPCPNTIEKTYSNGCAACADRNVISYIPGECEG